MILAIIVLLVDGLAYIALGLSILFPGICGHHAWGKQLPSFYLAMFKDYAPLYDGVGEEDADRDSEATCARHGGAQVGWRMAAYLLLLLGLCRVVTSFHWGCGYIILGLVTCLAEIGFLCNELLRYESARLHRTMGFVLHNVAVSLLYIGTALPHCRA